MDMALMILEVTSGSVLTALSLLSQHWVTGGREGSRDRENMALHDSVSTLCGPALSELCGWIQQRRHTLKKMSLAQETNSSQTTLHTSFTTSIMFSVVKK